MGNIARSVVKSLLVVAVLMTAAVLFVKDWPSMWFVILMFWPAIWAAFIIMRIKDPQADYWRLKTYYNIEAIRHNTEKKP